jgi:hypothetical protein
MKRQPKIITDIPRSEVGEDAYDIIAKYLGWMLIGISGVILFCYIVETKMPPTRGIVVLILFFVIGIYLVLIRKILRDHKNDRVHKMLQNGLVYKLPFGLEQENSYEEWADSINEGHFRVGPRGFEFWLGAKKLVFFYNVGLAGERKKSEEAYNAFKEHLIQADSMLQYKLPEFTKSNIDLLDKRCFYHRSRRNQFIALCCNMLLFLCCGSIGGQSGVIITSIVCGIFESFILYFLAKGAYYHYKNELALKEALPDITLGQLKPYWGFIYMVLVFVINYIIQYKLIWW